MLRQPFLVGTEVIKTIEENGYEAFFVGGCVRDTLLGRQVGDIDITTSAKPQDIQAMFDNVIPVGIEHGTVIVRHKKHSFEVTTYRIDGIYSDKRHPDSVEFINQIDGDLMRRDFTINAMAMDKNGKVIDLFNGKSDLQRKLIRTVGDGRERFREDPLRIIRALRFSGQLGFSIEQDTFQAMIESKELISSLAVERITNEIEKLFSGTYSNVAIRYLMDSNIFKELPILKENPQVFTKLPVPMKPLGSLGELIALFHYITSSISITNWTKAWKCSNKTKKEAIKLVEALCYYHVHQLDAWLVYRITEKYCKSFLRLASILFKENPVDEDQFWHLKKTLPITHSNELEITGNDLIQLFPDKNKGPWIKELIQQIEHQVVFGHLSNKKSAIKEWVKCHPPVVN